MKQLSRPTMSGIAGFLTLLLAGGNLPWTIAQAASLQAGNIIYKHPLPPTRTVGGDGQGPKGDCPTVRLPLQALVPTVEVKPKVFNIWGLTTEKYPTLWIYVPYTLAQDLSASFILQDETNQEIYQKPISLPENPGIIRIQIPKTVAPLQADKLYRWSLRVQCDTPPLEVEGWIQRVELPPTLTQEIKTAKPQQQAVLYATHGIWYDAVTVLGEERLANPNNRAIKDDWDSLLEQGYEGLKKIAPEPIAP